MDLTQAITEAQKAKKLLIGTRTVTRALKAGAVARIAAAKNCPTSLRRDLQHTARVGSIELIEFPGDSLLLGEACGKPFGVVLVGFKR